MTRRLFSGTRLYALYLVWAGEKCSIIVWRHYFATERNILRDKNLVFNEVLHKDVGRCNQEGIQIYMQYGSTSNV